MRRRYGAQSAADMSCGRNSAGASPGMGESFYLFRFRLHNLPDAVARFNLKGGEYIEKPEAMSAYLEHLDRSNDRCTDFRETPEALRAIQRELWDR
ncbi:Scr1 family TA system antitoxin-like transcriptional regulator [Streptomyces chattanoogensis]